jgi:hypothetical protein
LDPQPLQKNCQLQTFKNTITHQAAFFAFTLVETGMISSLNLPDADAAAARL